MSLSIDWLHRNRRPTHPGHVLRLDVLPELKITQAAFADRLGITRHRLSEIHHGKRSVTPDTAMRLARVLGTGPEVWHGMQHALDLWDALHSPDAKKIAKLRPLKRSVA
jgi:addiction module HigA family antidote